MSAKITVQRVTAKDITTFFSLDSPGYFLARDAERAGEISGAADAIEVICLVNKLSQIELDTHIMRELEERCGPDRVAAYLRTASVEERTTFTIEAIGKEDMVVILQEVANSLKRQSAIRTGVNDPTKAARRKKS
jgi:hypothetical protein